MIAGLRSSTTEGDVRRLVLNNALEAIEDGRQEILRHLAPLSLSPNAVNRLEVVFEELVSNIIRHGFQPGSDQTILVAVAADPVAITLTIEDDGLLFDPLAAPRPGPETLGGRGVLAVQRMVLDLHYERVAADEGGGRSFAPLNRVVVRISTH